MHSGSGTHGAGRDRTKMSTQRTDDPRRVSPRIEAWRIAIAERWVPVADAGMLTPAAISVLSVIARNAQQNGRCNMTWEDLSREAHVSQSTARTTVAKAEKQNLLRAEGSPLTGIVITSQRWLLHARRVTGVGLLNRAARRAAAHGRNHA